MFRLLLFGLALVGLGCLTPARAQQVTLTDSNLPIVVIDTRGQTIPDDPKIACRFRVIWQPGGQRNALTDIASNYDGWAGIEVRGSSSQMFPKLSYGLELWTDSLGTDTPDSSLCGMPAEHDWVLSASYSDKTLLRNALTYHLGRELGRWAPRTVPCEVLLNGQYQGVYLLIEKVKRGPNRVDINKLSATDTTGDKLTGGYIIKVDKTTGSGGAGWTSAYAPPSGQGQTINFLYEYPKDGSIVPAQADYIAAYVDSFETALHGPFFQDPALGYARYADVGSFTDFFLLNEASRNVDGYRISTFLHKPRTSRGGRLTAGPVWDYDIAWHNADYCNGDLTTGWAWRFNTVCGNDGMLVPFWWDRLTLDSTFRTTTRCRWNDLRLPGQPLASATVMQWLDSMATDLQEAQQRNFQQWPILGQYVWPNPQPIASDYAGELANLKTWLSARFTWIDRNLGGQCRAPLATAAPGVLPGAALWPNPAAAGTMPRLTFALAQPATVWLEVFDAIGRQVAQSAPVAQPAAAVLTLPVPGQLPAGLYSVRLRTAAGPQLVRRLVVE